MRPTYLALILAATACAPRASPAPPGESPPAESADGGSYAITLYRSPCPSRCPVYSLTVTPSGLVTYQGTAEVRRLGTATSRVSSARVDALVRELEAAGYFGFASRYRPSEPGCGRYVPSYQSVITSVRLGNRTKRIEHDHGCGDAPQALEALERRIDEVLGSERWTGR